MLACGLIVASCGAGSPTVHVGKVDPPHEVIADGGTGWPLPGHDYANSRDALGSTLRASTINRIDPAWSIATPGALTTAVLVVGNTVYAEDDHGVVVAADKKTGRTLWQSVSTGFTVGPEGVAVGWGKVFAATADGIEALDARSGQVLWTRRLTESATAGVDMQPTVIGHRVLIANGTGECCRPVPGWRPGVSVRGRRLLRQGRLVVRHGRVQGPVGTSRRQLRWRRLVPAGDRHENRNRLLGNRQSGPVSWHAPISERIESCRPEPVHRFDGGTQPRHRSTDLVPPSRAA